MSDEVPLFYEPAGCDDLGNTICPYIIQARWSQGASYLVIDEPPEIRGMLVIPGQVYRSTDNIPRRLTPEEILEKVKTGTTRA